MRYKPDEKDWMAYLYGELEGEEKERMDQYLQEDAEARNEFAKFQQLRAMLSTVEDKEVIAPPIFVDSKQRFLWNAPYLKMIVSIAASLLIIILVGKAANIRVSVANNEFRLSFGEEKTQPVIEEKPVPETLTAEEIQQMINNSLVANNSNVQASLDASHQKLQASIRKNLDANSGRMDALVRQAASASQEQIQQYVTGIQAKNMEMVKEYFTLTSGEQKKYIEDILVDFAQYVNQQRNNDMQLVQTELNSLKKNTDVFKQETEQILTSIISSVTPTRPLSETKN